MKVHDCVLYVEMDVSEEATSVYILLKSERASCIHFPEDWDRDSVRNVAFLFDRTVDSVPWRSRALPMSFITSQKEMFFGGWGKPVARNRGEFFFARLRKYHKNHWCLVFRPRFEPMPPEYEAFICLSRALNSYNRLLFSVFALWSLIQWIYLTWELHFHPWTL